MPEEAPVTMKTLPDWLGMFLSVNWGEGGKAWVSEEVLKGEDWLRRLPMVVLLIGMYNRRLLTKENGTLNGGDGAKRAYL